MPLLTCFFPFQLAQQQQQQQQAAGGVNPLSGLRGPGAGADSLDGLRNNSHFEALRELVRQNPALIQPVIQQLAQNNPQMAQALANNPDALLQLLGEGQDDMDTDIPPGAQVISVTPEEREAIQRVSVFKTLKTFFNNDLHTFLSFSSRH